MAAWFTGRRASHCMSRSSHIVSDPRAFSAVLYAAQFVVRYFPNFFSSLMPSAYRFRSAAAQQTPFNATSIPNL